MKAFDYIFAALLTVLPAATAVAQTNYSDPKSSTGTHSDLEVSIGNDKGTTFNKFRKEHWNKIHVPDPRIKEKKELRDKVRKSREKKYGSTAGSGGRLPLGKSVGGAPKNRGGGYRHGRHGGYDRERDERLKADAMEKAERDLQFVRDLNNVVQGVIANDAGFNASFDGAMMAKAAKKSCNEMPEVPEGPKAD